MTFTDTCAGYSDRKRFLRSLKFTHVAANARPGVIVRIFAFKRREMEEWNLL